MAYDNYNQQQNYNGRNNNRRSNNAFHFQILEHIGVLGTKDNGWTKEVNIVSFNGGDAKVDIRDWEPGHKRMSKGVNMFEEEAEALARFLANHFGLNTGAAPAPQSDTGSGLYPVEEAPAPALMPQSADPAGASAVAEESEEIGKEGDEEIDDGAEEPDAADYAEEPDDADESA